MGLLGKWVLTDTTITIKSKTYNLDEVVAINAPTEYAKNEGMYYIFVGGTKHLITYHRKQKEEGEKAIKYIEEFVIKNNSTEIKKRCKVCNHIFCYSSIDLYKNASNQKSASRAAFAGAMQAIGGTAIASSSELNRSQQLQAQVIDYNRCPKCNSRDLEVLSDEQYEELNSGSNSNSVPDEIKKFKELLDNGIITQEEFDAKKKQLLGL